MKPALLKQPAPRYHFGHLQPCLNKQCSSVLLAREPPRSGALAHAYEVLSTSTLLMPT